MRDTFRHAVETAWNWAEYREVPVHLRRDDVFTWWFRLTFADTYGVWFEDVPVMRPSSEKGAEERAERLRKDLDAACARARSARIDYVKRRLH